MTEDIVIVGGGIIGTYCAIQIARNSSNKRIRIIDRNPEDHDGASSGNLGGFAVCEVQPLATLRNLLRAPSMMVNPLAPLTIRLGRLPEYSAWARRFVIAALTPGHFQRVVHAQSTLMERAYQSHFEVIGDSDLVQLISHEGTICVYRKARTMNRDWQGRWRLFRDRGEDCRRLEYDELHDRLPSLHRAFEHGVYIPSIKFWREPVDFLMGLHKMARDAGISIDRGEVRSIEFSGDTPTAVRADGGASYRFDQLVVCAGAWSGSLCQQLGDAVPVNTERGYSTTLKTATDINNLILFPDDDFVATPMNSGLRLGGTVELAGLKAPPNFRRTELLARQLQVYFPSISTTDRSDWMGHRPSLPDTLPVIGRSPGHANVIYAFGHGHVGMTQSAITGKLVSQVLADTEPEVDLKPFSISRFSS